MRAVGNRLRDFARRPRSRRRRRKIAPSPLCRAGATDKRARAGRDCGRASSRRPSRNDAVSLVSRRRRARLGGDAIGRADARRADGGVVAAVFGDRKIGFARLCALAHGIDFVEDEDNRNLARARNALRAEVLPAARARFPAVLRRLADFNRDCADIETILRAQAAADERRARRFGDGETAFWRQAGAARLRNYLFFALTARGVFAARGEICETARRVLAGGRGEEIFFARDGLELRADGRALSWLRALPRPPALAFDGRELARAGRLELPQFGGVLLWRRAADERRLERGRRAAGRVEVARDDGDFAPARGGGNNRFRRDATATKSARIVARGEDSALATRAFPAAGGGRTNRRRAGDCNRARLPRAGASDRDRNRDAIRFPRRISARRGALKD